MALQELAQKRSNGHSPDSRREGGLDLPARERRLIEDMRRKIREEGSRVELKEDHNGDLIAVEKVLHRASDYE